MEKQKKLMACFLICAMLLAVIVPNGAVFAAETGAEAVSAQIVEGVGAEPEVSEQEAQVETQTADMIVEETAKETGQQTSVVTNPTGKKGIIASYWTDPGTVYYDDPIALGVDHALRSE